MQATFHCAKSTIVGELTRLPCEHPAVALASMSILAPCLLLLIADRRRLGRAFPALNIRPEAVEATTRHMTEFALAGLAAIARHEKPSAATRARTGRRADAT